jgi:hypothetical protein
VGATAEERSVADPSVRRILHAGAAAARARTRALITDLANTEDELAGTCDRLAVAASGRGRDVQAAELRRLSELARASACRARLRTCHDGGRAERQEDALGDPSLGSGTGDD